MHYAGLIPDAAPEEFALISPVGRTPQYFSELVNSYAAADSNGHHQSPKVLSRSSSKMLMNGFEKTLQFFGNPANSNHMASPMISTCAYKSYCQDRPFLFNAFRNHTFTNRPV